MDPRVAADKEIVSMLIRHLPDNVKFDLLRKNHGLRGASPLVRSSASDHTPTI